MSFLDAIILAIIEGLTEFLPISSTGHMIIASTLMGNASNDFVKLFTVAIQFGAILSVVLVYFQKFIQSFRFYLLLAAAFVPTGIIGLLAKKHIDALLENVAVVAWMLLIGGIVLLFVDKFFAANETQTEEKPLDFKTATEVMFENDRYGQKNGKGFYDYIPDKRGKPTKTVSEEAYKLIAPIAGERTEFEREDIIARMMLPMATEMARCLEEGIVGSAAEADLALLYGIGFPPFRGGIFRWMDTVGLAHIAEASKKYAHLGKTYELTEGMQAKLANNETWYG